MVPTRLPSRRDLDPPTVSNNEAANLAYERWTALHEPTAHLVTVARVTRYDAAHETDAGDALARDLLMLAAVEEHDDEEFAKRELAVAEESAGQWLVRRSARDAAVRELGRGWHRRSWSWSPPQNRPWLQHPNHR